MTEITNPYHPGRPVADVALLFGRQNAADWIELQLDGNNRTLVLGASPLIGKTSFLRHVGALQNINVLNLLISLADASTRHPAGPEQDDEQTLYSVLRSIIDQLIPQLTALNLLDADYRLTSPQMTSVLRDLFAQAGRRLPTEQKLLLYVDDLHTLVTADKALIASFLTSLMPLLDECSGLTLAFAVNQTKLKQIKHPLLDGAPTFTLGPLASDASINMITVPVKDILHFDYGVTKRIAEINSHHPYYLALFCHTLLNRQVQDGWVNQRDFDATLVEILNAPIEPFTQSWEASSWPERAVLSGMAAIQGAHGPITGQEILRFLQRQNQAVIPDVILDALDTLVERGVLVPMGAVSYRFYVDLFRFWLREHTTLSEILAQVDWNRAAAQAKSKAAASASARPAARRMAATPEPRRAKRGRLWLFVSIFLVLCVMGVAGAAFAAQVLDIPIAYLNPPTPTATPTATPAGQEFAPLVEVTEEAVPTEPTPTVTPTAPVVVAKTLPSITYMGRDVDQNWLIYVMDADGSNVTALSSGEGDDNSPIWSPDGRRIAFVSRRDGNREIYVMDAGGQNVVNVTRHPADDWTPAWSPDGTRLAFSSFRSGGWEIYVMDTDCLAAPESCPDNLTQITNDDNGNLSPVWSADGARFAYNSKANGNWDIFTMAVDGTDIRQVTTAPENDLAPAWSPDGTKIAFESNRENNVEIYVVDVNGGVAQNITNQSQADDHGPVWSPDGSQIVFYSNREGNWDIFVTTVSGESLINLTQTPTRDEQTPAWRP